LLRVNCDDAALDWFVVRLLRLVAIVVRQIVIVLFPAAARK
jgi:hypothetical protein